ncbi:hypothetical protein PoB_002695400 [Plakobranchus ocellatus]|uniref:Uncharacterized protein n=1 Tax=Plakobranchus ocellatus TaxID=259542 RepID=A0AAV4A2K7_9GAST|nr:hypothetical protein PoB_002695400 [Plakobranchus ocellatus]
MVDQLKLPIKNSHSTVFSEETIHILHTHETLEHVRHKLILQVLETVQRLESLEPGLVRPEQDDTHLKWFTDLGDLNPVYRKMISGFYVTIEARGRRRIQTRASYKSLQADLWADSLALCSKAPPTEELGKS